eukprot:m.200604 g.200604  ORF g.200604 m.200604 type:complete len:558 (-) comp21112_c0_seq1:63-1736(-)
MPPTTASSCPNCRDNRLSREHRMLKARVHTLEVELEGYRDAETDNADTTLRETAARYRSEAHRARRSIAALSSRTSQAEAQRDVAHSTLKQANMRVVSTVGEIRHEHDAVKADMGALWSAVQEHTGRLVHTLVRQAEQNMATTCAAHQRQLTALNKTVATVSAERDAAKQAQADLSSRLDQAHKATALAQSETLAVKKQIDEAVNLKRTSETHASQVATLQGSLATREAEITQLRQRVKEAEDRLATVTATAARTASEQTNTWEAALREQQAKHTATLQQREAEMTATHQAAMDALRHTHEAALHAQEATHKVAMDTLKSTLADERKQALDALHDSMTAQRTASQAAQTTRVTELEVALQHATSELERAKSDAKLAQAEAARLLEEARDTARTGTRAQQEVGVLEVQLEHLRQQLADRVRDDAARNRTALARLETDTAPLRDRIETQKAEIRLLQNTVARECAERQALVAALEKVRKQRGSLAGTSTTTTMTTASHTTGVSSTSGGRRQSGTNTTNAASRRGLGSPAATRRSLAAPASRSPGTGRRLPHLRGSLSLT